MVNGTLVPMANASSQVVDVGTASSLFFTVVIPAIFTRLWAFFASPFIYPDMWWLLIHLVLTFILFEFYFERHEDENLGWSAALANSIVMIFISMELLRALFHHKGTPIYVLWNVIKGYFTYGLNDFMIMVTLVILLGILGIITAVVNYFHFLPRQIAWIISGHKTVNLLAYFLIVVVFRFSHENPMPLDFLTFLALLMFGAILYGIIFFTSLRFMRKQAAGGRRQFFK